MANIEFTTDGAIATIRLNNPASYNALAGTMIADMKEAVAQIREDESVRCLVLTGNGKGFCSGANLGGGELAAEADQVADRIRASLNPLIEGLRTLPIPVIVAVNGPAAGAGVGIALAGDFILAARSAKFVLSFIKVGLALDAGTSLLLQQTIGPARARGLAMLGEPLTADLAREWGLVWEVFQDDALQDGAMALARRLAGSAPLSLAEIKQEIEFAWTQPLDACLEREAQAQARLFQSRDLREGVAAFNEKRSPLFEGR